jgi:hypothetical protein
MSVAIVGLQAARTIAYAARGAALVARVPMNEDTPGAEHTH